MSAVMLDEKLIVQYLARPDLLGADDVPVLQAALERYPFCHVTRMLYLKALHNAGDLGYDAALADGAAFVSNRKALFELINRVDPSHGETGAGRPNRPEPLPAQDTPAEELTQWMDKQHGRKSPEELIDRFIRTNPRIKPAGGEPASSLDLSRPDPALASGEIMTETLARIYVHQKKYARAVEAYRILMLKNPKKSSFFADRIREIEKLKDKN